MSANSASPRAEAASSTADAGSLVNTLVQRTHSGLPLCSDCGIELGFCEHAPVNFGTRHSVRRGTVDKSADVPRGSGSGGGTNDHQDDAVRQSCGIKRPHGQGDPAGALLKGKRPAKGRGTVSDKHCGREGWWNWGVNEVIVECWCFEGWLVSRRILLSY